MPLTLRELVSTAELELTLLAQGPGIDLPVTWVHVSELRDPTPFLSGGELLLTTGIAFNRAAFHRAADAAGVDTGALDVESYVRRLSAASVVGLGFGTGLSHSRVPEQLVAAARSIGLPVVEVPRQTPFIAISRAVSKAVAADEYAAVTRTFTAQQALTKAALSPAGPQRLVRLLAQQLTAWVVLLDPAGVPVAAFPDPAADGTVNALLPEVTSLAAHRGTVSSAFPLGTDTVSLQSVGTGPRGRAFLAVGRPGPLVASDRHLVNAAVMLLTIRLEQSPARDSGIGRLRSALLRMVLAGQVELARPIAEGSSITLPTEPVAVVVLDAASGGVADLLASVDAVGGPVSGDVLVAELDDELVAIVGGPPDAAQNWAAQISRAGREIVVGISAATTYAGIADGHRQARQAADFGLRNSRAVTTFAEISMAGITGIVVSDAGRAFADALLRPLIEHDLAGRGDLVDSLRAWLTHHGQWDPSAAELGVHRHTLRNRMRTIEELLGRSLDAPGTRSELWFALELLDQG